MIVHSIESLAALDGEGLRYAVFLSGCPLRCVYCHNPDTWDAAGVEYTPEELFAKITRYTPYFRAGGGGVTFGGGEPLLWAGEIARLGGMLTGAGIGYTLDTSGSVTLDDNVRRAVSGAELVICDIKFPTAEEYTRHTGGNFTRVREFLDFLRESRKRTWARTVIVPGINDSEDALERYIDFLREGGAAVEKYQLLAFHTMGFFKYEELGIENKLKNTPALPLEQLAGLQVYLDKRLAEQ